MSKSNDADNRITARVPSHTRQTIEEAADIVGATMNQFVVQAALEKAELIVEKARVLSFSRKEASKIMELMTVEAKPNAALKKAMKRHKELLS